MAEASQVAEVRRNVDEPRDEDYGSDLIATLVDRLGVSRASATIWREKAAKFAKLVDVSEAGASHKFSDLHRNALEMAERYESAALLEVSVSTAGRPRVKAIERD